MPDNNQRAELEKQITQIKAEIAHLTVLLALRKMEEQHPLLEKLISGAERKEAALRQGYEHLSAVTQQKLENIPLGKSLAVLGGIIAIGSIGYALLSTMGAFHSGKK